MGNSEGGVLGFKIVSADLKSECPKLEEMMKQAGWAETKDSFTIATDEMSTKSMKKSGKIATISCSKDNADIQFVVSSGKDNSATTNAQEDKTEPSSVESTEVKNADGSENPVSTETLPTDSKNQ